MMRLITAAEVYNDWASHYDADTSAHIQWTAPDHTFRALRDNLQPGHTVLEMGIGTGSLAQRFAAARGVDIWGMDASSHMLQRVKSTTLLKSEQVLHVDAEQCTWPFADASFDSVYSCGVLEYIENTQHVINESARVLKPGGYLLHCFETSVDVQGTKTFLRRHAKGLDHLGNAVFGAFFYYHHAPEMIAAALPPGSRVDTEYVFNSTPARCDQEPVYYALLMAQKSHP